MRRERDDFLRRVEHVGQATDGGRPLLAVRDGALEMRGGGALLLRLPANEGTSATLSK